MAGAMAVLTAILSVIALLLEAWAKTSPAREQEAKNEAIQLGRQDLVAGNADAVTLRIDGLLADQADPSPGGNAGSEGSTDADRDALTRSRLVALGIRVG